MKGEMIGKTMEVINSSNKDMVGIHGKIVDETKNAIVIASEGQRKTILKKGSTFRIGDNTVKGDEIAVRPEDRVKL